MKSWMDLLKFALAQMGNPKLTESDEQTYANLLRMAQKLDFTATQVVADAKFMAEKWTAYARDAAEGRMGSNPANYSTVNEIVARAAQYEAVKEVFGDVFYALFGKGPVAVRKAMDDVARGAVDANPPRPVKGGAL